LPPWPVRERKTEKNIAKTIKILYREDSDMTDKSRARRPSGNAILSTEAQLTDRKFFDAHPDKETRRRPIIPAELPRSLAGRNIREVEVRNAGPDMLLMRFVDAEAAWPVLLPLFDSDLFLTPEGRQKIVSCLTMMNGFAEFMAGCARFETEDEHIQ
jgi:hypothetical protein